MKTLVRFNVQNVHYAMQKADGEYDKPVAYGTAMSMALQPDAAVKNIYGDGRRICSIMNERGKTATLGTNNISDDYEIAMGRKIKTANGLAEIKQQSLPVHAIYFETCGVNDDGSMPIAKTWIYGVTSPTRPSETFNQNTEDINESSFETALKIAGVTVTESDGTTVYKDPKTGKDVIAWQMTVTPDDEEFDTFGNAVVLPKMPATE